MKKAKVYVNNREAGVLTEDDNGFTCVMLHITIFAEG